jgi:hypothetical protein
MPRRTGRLLRFLLIVLVIAGAAIVAAPLLPLSPLQSAAELKLSETLGRKVTIDSVRLNILSGPCLTFTGMTAREDPLFGEGNFLQADEARADLDVLEYFRTRKLVIRSLTLKSPRINLVKNANGVWSWTTLGKPAEDQSAVSGTTSSIINSSALFLSLLTAANLSTSAFRKLTVENASVKLIDHTGSGPPETTYTNIVLNASISPNADGSNSQATGDLDVRSDEDGQAELFKASLPFNLQIEGRSRSALSISGTIGPGPIESENLSVGQFSINGKFNAGSNTPLVGEGRMSAAEMFIRPINLSERVARALKVDQIGDMNPGTSVLSLETDFQFSSAAVNTTGLRIQQLDGLGDATAHNGSFNIESALTVSYSATVVLSPDATSRAKSASPVLGLILTILESNNRVSVPIDVSGDVRDPKIQVDVRRIF